MHFKSFYFNVGFFPLTEYMQKYFNTACSMFISKRYLFLSLFGCSKVYFGLETSTVSVNSVFAIFSIVRMFFQPLDTFSQVRELFSLLDLFLKNSLDNRQDFVKSLRLLSLDPRLLALNTRPSKSLIFPRAIKHSKTLLQTLVFPHQTLVFYLF